MTCPHGGPHARAETCSQCLGIAARKVEQRDDLVFVDGVLERSIAPDRDPHIQQPRAQRRQRGRK